MSTIKEEAKRIIDNLSDQVTWDDIMYEFYVKKKLEISLQAAKEGKVLLHEEVRNKFIGS